MMEQYQFLGDAESQAEVLLVAAGRVSLIESVKDVGFVFLRDPAAFILNLKIQEVFLLVYLGLEENGAARRSVVSGIVQKNHEDLPDTVRISPDMRKGFGGQFQMQGNSFFPAGRLNRFQ